MRHLRVATLVHQTTSTLIASLLVGHTYGVLTITISEQDWSLFFLNRPWRQVLATVDVLARLLLLLRVGLGSRRDHRHLVHSFTQLVAVTVFLCLQQ